MLWFEGPQPEQYMESEEYSQLPPRERATKYRELASDAGQQAELVSDRKLRESYLIIAERWDDMAADIDRRLARGQAWEVD
ncbi:MAG TPA: hypothetical protein VEU06_05650 [Micropepsaceae bacterium]|nr:hypothetical protein [Micropepsaceae bacterium]